LSSIVSKDGELVYCNDLEGLLQELGCTHNPEEWRLFVDKSEFTLEAAQLHNGNIHLSIPNAHSVYMKETYENMHLLLRALSYSKYGWKICEDLKVIGLLLGSNKQADIANIRIYGGCRGFADLRSCVIPYVYM
jgi:hypothetical protein